MKNSIVKVFMLILLLLPPAVTVKAEEKTSDPLVIEVEAAVEGGGYIEISGEEYLPETTLIKDRGKFVFNYGETQPGQIFHYEVRQAKKDDYRLIYDEAVYSLDIYILYDEDLSNRYAVAVLHKNGEEDKPTRIDFINSLKKGNVYVVYIDTEGKILKQQENVCPSCIIDTDYNTEKLKFNGYEFLKMKDDSAAVKGKSIHGDLYITYIYRKLPDPPKPAERVRQLVSTGAGQAVLAAGVLGIGALAGLLIVNGKARRQKKEDENEKQ